jgi:hypothetical protein
MGTVAHTTLTAYRSELELDGDTLRVVAVGKSGYMALGTHEREIDLSQVSAISFDSANMMKNGSLVLVDQRGKTHVHFRRKSNAEMRELYDAICTRVPVEAIGVSTKGVGLIHEDADTFLERVDAWAEQKKAEREARRSKPDE